MSTLEFYLISLSILIAASFVILRIFVRRDYFKYKCLSIRTAILQAAVFFVFGGFPVIYLPSDWPKSYVNQFIRSTGWICIALGLAVLLIALFRLGFLRSMGLKTGAMKGTGLYKVSRNPQALGCALYVIGFLILWPSLYASIWAAVLITFLHIMVITEEEHLLNTFNEDYEQYCNRIPRYFGYPK